MMVVEEGISAKSFAICTVSTVIGIGMMIFCLKWTPGKPMAVQIGLALFTILFFIIGVAAWSGLFDSKAPPAAPPKQEGFVPEPVLDKGLPKPKMDGVDQWVKNYLKGNK